MRCLPAVFLAIAVCLLPGISALGQSAAVGQIDLIHPGDVVEVDVVGSSEYDWRGSLAPDGSLDGAIVFDRPIHAVCRSTDAIAGDIAEGLSKLLRDPKVIVTILDRAGREPARVIGAVRTPTRFRIGRVVSLRELIVRSGGFTDDLSGEIVVVRPENAGCEAAATRRIKVSDLLKGDETGDLQILSGDTVEVERSSPVYVIGAVNSPRPVYSRDEMTVSRAVASAGGLAKDADGGKAVVFRREAGETKTFDVDLASISKGRSVDVVLKPFDIIDVAGKGAGKRKLPPVAPNTEDPSAVDRELPLRVIDKLP